MATPVRYKLVSTLFAGSAVNFIDRVNISVAAPAMMLASGWQKDEFGLVFSAFLFGYATAQIPSGLIADRYSARRLLAWAFCGFSLFTALTPVGALAILPLLVVRFLVGACEAATFPSITAINSKWFPASEFARAQTISLSGGSFGQMIAYPLTAWIVLHVSWQAAFYVSACLGFVWVVVWLRTSTDHPKDHPAVGAPEHAVTSNADVPSTGHGLPLRSLLTAAPVIVLSLGAMCFGFVLWTFVFWFPTYLIESRNLSLAAVGVIGIGIQASGLLGTIVSGVVSDKLLKKTLSPRLARPVFAGACIAISMALLLGAISTSSVTLSVALFGLFYFSLMTVHVAFLATPAALHPRSAGTIFGVINCCASLGAVLGPAVVGVLVVHAHSWAQSFALVSLAGFVCAALLLGVPVRRLTLADGSGGGV